MKQKCENLKNENQRLIDENKELSTFSLENIDTAIHMQKLSVDRDEKKATLQEADEEIERLLLQ